MENEMEIMYTKRLDHLGVVMGVIRELGIIDMIDQKIGQHDQNHVTSGESVAAMIMNGLGFVSRPLSLTPHFFETKALDVLFGKDIQAQNLNRHKLGRVLDDIHAYGSELLFSEIALRVCEKVGTNSRFTSLDTTSFSVSGAYEEQTDEQAIVLRHGYSKDHRPDLKQVVLELVTSHDGGIPLMMKTFDGNASDNKIFKERCQAFVNSLEETAFPRFVVGDSKLYHKDNIPQLKQLGFITRIPGVYKAEREAILEAISNNQWTLFDSENSYYEKNVEHFGLKQRWFVVKSTSAQDRALKTLSKKIDKEYTKAKKAIMHLWNKEFACEKDARKYLEDLSKTFTYHELIVEQIICRDYYETKGRPQKGTMPNRQIYKIRGTITCLPEVRKNDLIQSSCYVIGTNGSCEELSGMQVIEVYKKQNMSVERGFRFLKDPMFFVSSFFLKKPSRIMSLLMIMTLSLLVYSIAQRHLRNQLLQQKETLPNQINKPVQNPTMRWVFQLLEGIDVIYSKINNTIHRQVLGITNLKEKILRLFYEPVLGLYQLNPNIIQMG